MRQPSPATRRGYRGEPRRRPSGTPRSETIVLSICNSIYVWIWGFAIEAIAVWGGRLAGRATAQGMGAQGYGMLTQLKTWLYPGLIVALVFAAWSGSWHAGLGKSDFAGHVGLMATFAEQFGDQPTLHFWTSDWNAGSSLVFWYLHPLISSFVLLPFAEHWGLIDGLRIGDTFFIALAGLSMYAWCRHLTSSTSSAFIGALVYALHPSVFAFVGEVGQVHQPISLAIVPLLFLAWTRLGESADRSNVLLAAIASALLFYDMERFWLILPHALVVYAAVVWRHSETGNRSVHLRRGLGLALLVGLGMTLLVAFPTLPGVFERPLLQWHDSQSIDVFRRYYSFPHLLALVDRDGILALQLSGKIAQEFVSLPGQWYQGAVALFLITVGAVLLAKDRAESAARNQLAIVLLLFVAALLVAFGVHAIAPKHGSLFGGLIDRPLGATLTGTLFLLASFVASFLGAAVYLFYHSLTHRQPRNRGLVLTVLGLGVLAFLFAKPFVLISKTIFIYAHLRAPSHFAFPALPFLVATAVSLVIPVWMRAMGTKWRIPFVVAVATLILFDVSPYRFQSDWSYPDERVESWEAAFARLEDQAPGRMLDTHHYNPIADMLTVDTAGRDMAWGWLSWTSTRFVGDIVKTGFFDSMRIARARADVRESNTQLAAELSALANVRFVSRLAGISPTMPESDDFIPIEQNEFVEMYENRKVLSYVQFYPERALLIGSVNETVPLIGALAQEGIASLTLEDGAPDASLHFDYWRGNAAREHAPPSAKLLGDSAPFRASPQTGGVPENRAPCETVARRSASIELNCDFSVDGTLVIAEAWFPDWQVSVNGARGPSLRFNHAFQGVAVTAGQAQVRFAHTPSAATQIAVVVSATSWLVALGTWLIARRRSTRAVDPRA